MEHGGLEMRKMERNVRMVTMMMTIYVMVFIGSIVGRGSKVCKMNDFEKKQKMPNRRGEARERNDERGAKRHNKGKADHKKEQMKM